jgi:PadR family transcriptional regulator, regulatory protein PadR
MSGESLKGHLDVLLLQIVADQPRHGYDIVTQLRERSKGAFDLPEGTVYPALHRLERKGLVSADWQPGERGRRKVYTLTVAGRTELGRQRFSWQQFQHGMNAILGVT